MAPASASTRPASLSTSVAVVVSHPIQHFAPFHRAAVAAMAQESDKAVGDIDLAATVNGFRRALAPVRAAAAPG